MRIRFWKRKPEEYNLGAGLTPKPEKLLGAPLKPEKYGKTYKVPGVLLDVNKGFCHLSKIHSENGEIIEPVKGETIYNGLVPVVVEVDRNIIPSFWMRMFMKKNFRVRFHLRLAGEPFTRDPADFKYLEPEKKRKVLIERGFIDSQGFLLKKPELTKDGQPVTIGSNRMEISGCHVKPDVSDIDFIKQEFHAYEQSKNNQKMADAMAKTGKPNDAILMWLMLGFMLLVGAIVFMMSGGAEGWF